MLKLVAIAAFIAVSLAKDCPNAQSISPCTCVPNAGADIDWENHGNGRTWKNIYCGGNEEINLSQVFKNISKELPETWERVFHSFYLNNTKVKELPENLFSGITFDGITIQNAFSLTRIHSTAFNGTTETVGAVEVSNTPLDSNGADYDVFKALNSLSVLNSILLSNTSLRHIPDNAFGPKNSILWVEIVYGSIESIGKHAFRQLNYVKYIRLSSNKINNISEGAFASVYPREKLTIDLSGNKLNSTNLNAEIFAGLETSHSTLNLEGNPLTYLAENIFGNYLANDHFNEILTDNLDCTDCRNNYLVKKHRTSASDTLKCSDHTLIYNDGHFANCLIFKTDK